jgi:hypothetical protein
VCVCVCVCVCVVLSRKGVDASSPEEELITRALPPPIPLPLSLCIADALPEEPLFKALNVSQGKGISFFSISFSLNFFGPSSRHRQQIKFSLIL